MVLGWVHQHFLSVEADAHLYQLPAMLCVLTEIYTGEFYKNKKSRIENDMYQQPTRTHAKIQHSSFIHTPTRFNALKHPSSASTMFKNTFLKNL
jgi:hypothetical protein